jgi:hypothetical protein
VLGEALGLHHGVAEGGRRGEILDSGAHRVDYAADLDHGAVAGALENAPAMGGAGRVDEIASKSANPRREPGIAGDVCYKNCRELAHFGHGTSFRKED